MKGGNLCNKLKSHIFVFLGHSLEIQWVFLFNEKNMYYYGIDRILIIFYILEEKFYGNFNYSRTGLFFCWRRA